MDPITAVGSVVSIVQLATTIASKLGPDLTHGFIDQLAILSRLHGELNAYSEYGAAHRLSPSSARVLSECRATLEKAVQRLPSDNSFKPSSFQRLLTGGNSKFKTRKYVTKQEAKNSIEALRRVAAEIQRSESEIKESVKRRLSEYSLSQGLQVKRTPSSVLDYEYWHLIYQRKRVGGTGEWFLKSEAYQKWLRSSPGTVLCCYGIPGSGKSFIVSRVIDSLQTRTEAGVAYHYFENWRKPPSAKAIVKSLLDQLYRRKPELRDNPIPADDPDSPDKKPGLEELLDALIVASSRFSTTCFVFDALDRCDSYSSPTFKQDRNTLALRVLRQLQVMFWALKKAPCKLLVTSRCRNIVEQLIGPSMTAIIGADKNDIRLVVEARIGSSNHTIDLADTAFINKFIEKLIVNAHGMFLYASLMAETAIETLRDGVSQAVALQNIDLPPVRLDKFYDKTLLRISEKSPPFPELTNKLFNWMSFSVAKRPLSMVEMRCALKLEESQEITLEDVVDACLGLVKLDETNDSLQFAHQSVLEYFYGKGDDFIQRGHKLIAQTCLEYLTTGEFSGFCATMEEHQDRLQKYSLLKYAGCFWGFHASRVEDPSVEKLSISLFKDPLHWASAAEIVYSAPEKHDISELESATPLHIASHFGLRLVLRLIKDGENVNARGPWKTTPLIEAAREGHLTTVQLLLNHNANLAIDCQDSDHRTALYFAAQNNYVEIIDLLLSQGAGVVCYDSEHRTPLQIAALKGHQSAVEKLLKTPSKHPKKRADDLMSAFCAAAEVKATNILKTFLLQGEILHVEDANGSTILHRESSVGDVETLQVLLDNWANLESKNNMGETALHFAAASGNAEAVSLLLEYGAEINSVDCYGRTALSVAVETKHAEIARDLIDFGASVEIPAGHGIGKTVFQEAALTGQLDIARLLIARGARIAQELSGKGSKTVLHEVIRYGHLEIVRLLLDNGVDVECKDGSGATPLLSATIAGHLSIVQELVGKGANCNARDLVGKNGLLLAAEHGREDLVLFFLKIKAKVDGRDTNGDNAISLAAKGGHKEIICKLMENGAQVEVDGIVSPDDGLPSDIQKQYEAAAEELIEKEKAKKRRPMGRMQFLSKASGELNMPAPPETVRRKSETLERQVHVTGGVFSLRQRTV